MRQLIITLFCVAATALISASSLAESLPNDLSSRRPDPPTEPSIPIVEKSVAARQEPMVPKQAVWHEKIVHRIAKAPVHPVTMPSPEILVVMLRGTLAAVNQANFTENYSVLRGMMTPAVQSRVSTHQLGKVFAGLRKQNLDLSPMLFLSPQLTTGPMLTPDGVLRLKGVFPSRPLQIEFSIDYRAVDGFWLVETLSVAAAQVSAVAAHTAAPAHPQAVAATPAPDRQAASVPIAQPTTVWPQAAPPRHPAAVVTAQALERTVMRVPAQYAFWERRFVRETFLGPYLKFAEYVR